MSAIWQKIRADLLHHRAVSILMIGTIAIAATLLTLALTTLTNLGGPYERIFAQVNGAHLWLFFKPGSVSATDRERIAALPGVASLTAWQYSHVTQVRIHGSRVWVTLRVAPAETADLNRLYFMSGRGLQPKAQEILVEKFLNDTYHLNLNDPITITRSDGKDVKLPVVGFAYDVMYDVYRAEQPAYLYVSETTLRSLFPDRASWDQSLGLRLSDPGKVESVLAEVEAMRSVKFVQAHTDWRDVKGSAIFGGQLASIFLSAFSFFAILATIFIIISVVSSSILAQIKQIGILKALGFTSGQILLVYVGQYLVLGLIGSTLGFCLGLILAPVPMQAVSESLNSSYTAPFSFPLLGLVFSIILGATGLATLSAATRGARTNIIKSISIGAEAPATKMFWGARLAEHLGAPVVVVLGLNDIFVKPLRSFLTTLNLALGVIGIVFGLALTGTIQIYRANPALLGIVYDAVVTRQQTSDSIARRLVSRAPGVEAFYSEIQVKAWASDEQSFNIRAVDGKLGDFPFQIIEGRFFQPGSNEAIAGKGLLDWLGISIGDAITVRLDKKDGPAVTLVIVGAYPEAGDAGQRLMVNLASVRHLIKNNDPNTYYLKLSPDADIPAIRAYLAPHRESDLNVTAVGEAIPTSIIYLQLAIFALAGILIVIAIINVLIMSLLTAQEKLRVIGILKTIGMTPGQIVQMFSTTAAGLGLLGVLIGVPLGLSMTQNLLALLSNSFGFGKINVFLDPIQAVALAPMIIFASIAGSYIPARWAARQYIVKVLRKE
jgi:putative ABC transport system permease protein